MAEGENLTIANGQETILWNETKKLEDGQAGSSRRKCGATLDRLVTCNCALLDKHHKGGGKKNNNKNLGGFVG